MLIREYANSESPLPVIPNAVRNLCPSLFVNWTEILRPANAGIRMTVVKTNYGFIIVCRLALYFTSVKTKPPQINGVAMFKVLAFEPSELAFDFVRHRQFLSAFGAPAGKNGPPCLGAHSGHKPVRFRALALFWLVCSFGSHSVN